MKDDSARQSLLDAAGHSRQRCLDLRRGSRINSLVALGLIAWCVFFATVSDGWYRAVLIALVLAMLMVLRSGFAMRRRLTRTIAMLDAMRDKAAGVGE